jgi:hypothetical protein
MKTPDLIAIAITCAVVIYMFAKAFSDIFGKK